MESNRRLCLARLYFAAKQGLSAAADEAPFAGMTPQSVMDRSSSTPSCISQQLEAAYEQALVLHAASEGELTLEQIQSFRRGFSSKDRSVKRARSDVEARVAALERKQGKLHKLDPVYRSMTHFLPEDEWSTVQATFASCKPAVIDGLKLLGHSEASAMQLFNEDALCCASDFIKDAKDGDGKKIVNFWEELKVYLVAELPARQ